MAETVFKKYKNIKVSDIEFKMSKPNFTIDTLKEFKKRHKYDNLILLIGEDNLIGFNKWKDYKKIIEIAEVYVYPRNTNQKIPDEIITNSNIKLVDNELTIKFREPFLPRRGRVNCSVNDNGKWRWFGTQFIIR